MYPRHQLTHLAPDHSPSLPTQGSCRSESSTVTTGLFQDICLSSRCTDSGSDLLRSTFIHGVRPGSWNEAGASSLFIVVRSGVL